MINNGSFVEPDAVKIEELINYFDYNFYKIILTIIFLTYFDYNFYKISLIEISD